MNRRMPEAIPGHLGVPPHCHLHFIFVFLLFEKKICDLISHLPVSDNNEFPGLPIASRWSPPGAVENLSNHLIENIFCLIVSTDTSPAGGQLEQTINVHHTNPPPI